MKHYLFLLASLVCFGCSKDSPAPAVTPLEGGPIAWGAVSVDLNLQEAQATNVYYVIATKELSIAAADVKTQSKTPTDASIKFHGSIALNANEPKQTTITSLTEHTKYFSYVVKESNSTLSDVEKTPFETYYRQDTSATNTYHSNAESREVRYIIYKPEEVLKYGSKKQYPILIFMGGNGEVGDPKTGYLNYFNNNRTLPEYILEGTTTTKPATPSNVPLMVFTIQHTKLDWNVDLIDEGVVFAIDKFNVDPKKVYMTGCSGGGFGCWNYAVAHADKLAAIVPVSGGGNTGKACALKDVAIWAFHNAIDKTVDPSNSQKMYDAVKACPPTKEVTLTYFNDIDNAAHHDCWRRVYNQDDQDWAKKTPDMKKIDIYSWLLTKSK